MCIPTLNSTTCGEFNRLIDSHQMAAAAILLTKNGYRLAEAYSLAREAKRRAHGK